MNYLRNSISTLSVFLFVLVLSTSGQAKDDNNRWGMSLSDMQKIRVDVAASSGKNAQDLFSTPSTVSIIESSTIKRYGFTTVAEAVEVLAGISVPRTYLKRDVITSRGILQDHYSNKILILIDGIPAWHGSTGEGNLSRVNIGSVERIEVLKGPASVIYGTNAYAGAINIVLQKSEDQPFNTHMTIGNGNVYETGVSYFHKSDNYHVKVSASTREDQGVAREFTDESGVTGDIYDYIRGGNISLDLKYKNYSLFFNGFSAEENFLGVTPKFTGGAGEPHNADGYLINFNYARSMVRSLDLRYSLVYDYQSRDLSRSDADDIRASVVGSRLLNRAVITSKMVDRLVLEIGGDFDIRQSYEYRNYNVLSDSTISENHMKDRSISEFSLFGLANYEFSRFILYAGSRMTNNELFGTNLSNTGSAVFRINDENSLKLMIGQSYRAPSLFELYFQTPTMTVLGNENLDPELSTSFELAYLTSFRNLFVQALGYHAVYDNKIFRGKIPDGTSVYTNGQEFSANGLELEIKYFRPESITGFIQIAYIDGDDGDKVISGTTESYNFMYVPDLTATIGLSIPLGSGGISMVGHYEGEREGPFEKIDAQNWIDLNLYYLQSSKDWNLRHSFMVKNLSDQELLVPEYVRRNTINSVPMGVDRRFMYQISISR